MNASNDYFLLVCFSLLAFFSDFKKITVSMETIMYHLALTAA